MRARLLPAMLFIAFTGLPVHADAVAAVPTPVVVAVVLSLGPALNVDQLEQQKAAYFDKVAAVKKLGPPVTQKIETAVTFITVDKKTEDDLASLIVNKYKGCEKMDDACKSLIINLNHGLRLSNVDAALAKGTAGEMEIPVAGWSATSVIDVGSQHRIAKSGTSTSEFYSQSLAKALGVTAHDSAVMVDDVTYFTHIIIEPDPTPYKEAP